MCFPEENATFNFPKTTTPSDCECFSLFPWVIQCITKQHLKVISTLFINNTNGTHSSLHIGCCCRVCFQCKRIKTDEHISWICFTSGHVNCIRLFLCHWLLHICFVPYVVHYKTSCAFGPTLDYKLCGKQRTFETAQWKCFCIFQFKKHKPADRTSQPNQVSVLFSAHFAYRKETMRQTEVGVAFEGCLNASPRNSRCIRVILMTFVI